MTDKVIMEESSEKRKRGRPRIHPDEVIRQTRSMGQKQTERGHIEWLFMAQAYGQIKNVWEADPTGTTWADYYIKENGHILHKSILAALGRIEDKEDRLTTARIMAEKKLSTRTAVAHIRRVRLGREDKPGFLNLVGSIETALNAYLAAHPSTPMDMVVRALREPAEMNEGGD